MRSLLLVTALALGTTANAAQKPVAQRFAGEANPLAVRAAEKDELLKQLDRDLFKVDRAIGETERLIQKSRNAPYLPDLQFRLAELYVEKSRYTYLRQASSRPEGMKGALVSPETRLLKAKAVQLYERLLREWPDFQDADQVTFFLAHEQRELGQFDEMLATLGQLSAKYPKSPLRLEAELILGDHFFDKADLATAERHYEAVLAAPPSAAHDLARYKMGWIRVNQARHAEAVTYFEAAAASEPLPGQDARKALNVKREALLDLVYSYTEARKPNGAINYFEKLSDSRATFVLALDKLSNRYFVKQQYEWAIPALRRLMELVPDPELDLERSQKLYDSLKLGKNRVLPAPPDIAFLIRAAVQVRRDPERTDVERKKTLDELEEMARDLSTTLHVAAQKKDERGIYQDAAEAYRVYLSLFRPEKHVRTMMKNRADALYAARDFPSAARQFEELARIEVVKGDAASQEEALYGALLAHYATLQPEVVKERNAFEVADARQAMKLLGADYLGRFPKSDKVPDVKFNIARAHYEDGEFPKAAELFEAFALAHPKHKEATVAGNLALDALRQRNDFKGLEATGQRFLKSPLPSEFRAQVQKILARSEAEALDELALESAQATGNVIEGLVKVAADHKGSEMGEKALYGAFTAAREKRDLEQERQIGRQFVGEYPKSGLVTDVLLTLGQHAAEAARFKEAAGHFENVGRLLGGDVAGVDGYLSASRLYLALGDTSSAARVLTSAIDVAGAARRPELLGLLSQTYAKQGDWTRAQGAARDVLKVAKQSAAAAAVLVEAETRAGTQKASDALVETLTTVAQGPDGQSEEVARALWHLGELLYRDFKAMPASQLEEKVAGLQGVEGVLTQSAGLGYPEWAVASLWKIGMAYQHLAQVVETTPNPTGLSAAEAREYQTALKGQVESLRERADSLFKACVSRADATDVFTPAVLGCRKRTDDARVAMPAPGTGAAPGNLEALRTAAEQTMSAEALEKLGLAWLAARELGLAELTLSRAAELEEGRASAHSALGWALLLRGDSMGARMAYGRALDADPTFDKARLNLAALKCRFGDVEGARREVGVVKDTSGHQGPDVDDGWRTCK